MKLFHNATIGKMLAIIFAIGIHLMFAVGAYYLGLFLADLVLDQAGGVLANIIAIGYASAVFLGSSWAFVYGEYAEQDVQAYASVYGGIGVWSLRLLIGFIGLNEIGSLGFRLTQVDPTRRVWLGVAGVALLGIAYMLGKVIHAMANRPVQVELSRMIDGLGRSLVSEVARNAPRLSAADKLRVLQGDHSPLAEVRDVREQERLEVQRAKAEAQEEKAMRKRQAQEEREERSRSRREREAQQSALADNLATRFLQPGEVPEERNTESRIPFRRSR